MDAERNITSESIKPCFLLFFHAMRYLLDEQLLSCILYCKQVILSLLNELTDGASEESGIYKALRKAHAGGM